MVLLLISCFKGLSKSFVGECPYFWQVGIFRGDEEYCFQLALKMLKTNDNENIIYVCIHIHANMRVDYIKGYMCEHCSVVSNSLQPNGLQPARLLCSWSSPGQNTGVGSCFLLQGIFPIQGSNPGLPHCRWILYHLSHQGSPCTCIDNINIMYICLYMSVYV